MSTSVFISHRRRDRRIADVLRRFVLDRTRGDAVVRTSDDFRERRRPQLTNTSDLRQAVWECQVLFVVYTGTGRGWPEQMWELGVASAPGRPEPQVMVFRGVDGPVPGAVPRGNPSQLS